MAPTLGRDCCCGMVGVDALLTKDIELIVVESTPMFKGVTYELW